MGGVLTELHIENLGVIERLDIVLHDGLTVVTGETGAGKTMVVEAIELLVGERATASSVRHGADEARVEGRFVRADGTETVVARVVPADGRSRAYVDGRLATVASLAGVVGNGVDLHGQHAHQRLLSTATQREALDAYGAIELGPLRRARATLTEIDAHLAALGGDERARAREIDLLRFQVAELAAAAIADPAEDQRLDAEESVLADAAAHREAGEAAVTSLSSDSGVRDALSDVVARLDGRAPFTAAASRLRDLLAELDDVAAELRGTAEAIDEDPARLDVVRERRQLLRDLRRKYGEDLAAVTAYHAEADQRLQELERHDERAAALESERERALDAERAAAAAVGRERRRVAPLLAADVQARLRQLAMPHVEVAIEVGEHADDHPGDRVRFLLAANPGSPLLPLTRVASGGELARAMLALRLALTGTASDGEHDLDTLVFDEVDAGIGGDAARSVGDALAALGRHHQVLVVTHLAQVAAVADHQIVVDKVVRGGVTTASARRVVGEERVDEITRMLSGARSAPAREHARDLLDGT
jgi:DNA repair protein RecN (Recombination protein N)